MAKLRMDFDESGLSCKYVHACQSGTTISHILLNSLILLKLSKLFKRNIIMIFSSFVFFHKIQLFHFNIDKKRNLEGLLFII